MIAEIAFPFLAGLLVGVNPYTAWLLRARQPASRAVAEAGALVLAVAGVLGLLTWTFAGFTSGRLTNGMLFLGLFALVGAFHALHPLGRAREAPTIPTGWRWPVRYVVDTAYYCGPAWLLATFLAMRTLDAVAYATPFAAAGAGGVVALVLAARRRDDLPEGPPRRGAPRSRAHHVLGLAYAGAAVLVLAGWVGWFW